MIVMKFGGTSVEDAVAIDRAASIVRSRLEQRPVVVVSAMARITDQLLAMSQAAGKGDVKTALELSRGIRDRHHATASELLGSGGSAQLRAEFDTDFNALDDLLRGIAAVGELTPRTMDNVAGYGERMSSKLVAAAFRSRGLNAEMVDSRQCIVTNNSFSKAVPLFDETNERLVKRLAPMLNDSNPRVPVMGGFIGSTVDGIPTTIGRGGSDFSAAIIGAALDAGAIEIWTDVDGMKTTDPKICPDALRIKSIGFDEAAELAYFGAKVLHPSTVLPAVQKDIPVLVLNSRNPENQGTRITARPPSCHNLFKAIAAKKRITILDITATRMLGSHGYLRSIFEVFDRHRCPVDVVTTSEVSISITIDSNDAIPALVADLEKICDVKLSGRNAIVCLVGENIREIKGVAAQVFNAVAAADVNVRMISQGASEINITFVVTEDDVPKAVRALHDAFFKNPDWEVFAKE